jgi:hypothetical protein
MNQALPALPDRLQASCRNGAFKLKALSRTRRVPTTGPNMWNQNLIHRGAFSPGNIQACHISAALSPITAGWEALPRTLPFPVNITIRNKTITFTK